MKTPNAKPLDWEGVAATQISATPNSANKMVQTAIGKRFLYDLMEQRKSVRKFKDTEVPLAVLQKIMEAGLHAASSKNEQNWRFFVLTGEKKEDYKHFTQKCWVTQGQKLKGKLKPSLYAFTQRFFYTLGDAPVVILCYSTVTNGVLDLSTVGSVFLAMQNVILAAQAENLGSCVMGAPLEFKDEIGRFLQIEKYQNEEDLQLELVSSIVLGYPDHEPPKAPRKREFRVRWL